MKAVIALVFLTFACAYGTPVESVDSIEPQFDAFRHVRILLQTRQNRDNPQQIQFRDRRSVDQSHFSRFRPTRVLIHGWWEDDESDISTETSAALLDQRDFNVLFIDWSEGSRTINYVGASNRVETIGIFVAAQLDFLHDYGYVHFSHLKIIGFSLGAHIAGHIGKNVHRGRIGQIVGLDPAGPLFSERRPAGRLDAGDADYVEVIHTNGPTLVLVGAGIGAPIGDADFFVNGGTSQPGCWTNTCAHLRAVSVYVESLKTNSFYALACPTRDNISSRRCTITPGAWMGGERGIFHKTYSGSFYLETNRNAPFAQGPRRA